jgi:hypothetical protein
MATTTTNYQFDVPTSSDLVKNGATAIAELGQDIDTFLFRPFTRNAIINGGFDIWQRGTSAVTATSSSTGYAADRFQIYRGGFATGATLTRQVTNDTTNLPFIQYCARVQRDSGNTNTASYNISTNLESSMSIPYAGRTFTLSFYARAGANYSTASSTLRAIITNGTGTDQNGTTGAGYTGSNSAIYQNVTLTTTWQRFSITATMPSNATEFLANFEASPVGTAGANDYFEITGVQVEIGNKATPFTRAGGTIQGELSACQRYYYRESGTANILTSGFGQAYSTTNTYAVFKPKSTMRVTPTSIDFSNLRATNGISSVNATSVALWTGAASAEAPAILITTAGTFTTTTSWAVDFSGTGFIGFNAEL